MSITSLVISSVLLASSGSMQVQKQYRTWDAKEIQSALAEAGYSSNVRENAMHVTLHVTHPNAWQASLSILQGTGLRSDNKQHPTTFIDIQSRFQASTPPDRQAIATWVNTQKWEELSAYHRMNSVVEIKARFVIVESLSGFLNDVARFKSLTNDLQTRSSGKVIDPMGWSDKPGPIPDSARLDSLSSLELGALIDQWGWQVKPNPVNEIKSLKNTLRGGTSLGMMTGYANIEGIEVRFWIAEDEPVEGYLVSADVPVDEGANIEAIVKGLKLAEPFGRNEEAYNNAMKLHGFYESGGAAKDHYWISRNVQFSENAKVGQFRTNIINFAKRVAGLPRR